MSHFYKTIIILILAFLALSIILGYKSKKEQQSSSVFYYRNSKGECVCYTGYPGHEPIVPNFECERLGK